MLATWFSVSALTSVAHVALLAGAFGGARVRDAGFYVLGRLPLSVEINFYRYLPHWLSKFYSLFTFDDISWFALVVLAANLILNGIFVLAVVLATRIPILRSKSQSDPQWLHGLVCLAIASPVFYRLGQIGVDAAGVETKQLVYGWLIAFVVTGATAFLLFRRQRSSSRQAPSPTSIGLLPHHLRRARTFCSCRLIAYEPTILVLTGTNAIRVRAWISWRRRAHVLRQSLLLLLGRCLRI
jgi:hypothetical protein